jgi:hypothetical protein
MRTSLIGILLCLVFVRQAAPQGQQSLPQLNLMPMPRSVQRGTGRLVVASSFSIAIDGYKNELLERAAQRLFLELSKQTGMSTSDELVDIRRMKFANSLRTRAIAAFASFQSSTYRGTARVGSPAIRNSLARRGRTKSSANGEFSIRPWTPRVRKPTIS